MIYTFVGKDQEGKIHRGDVEAHSVEQAAEILRDLKVVPVKIAPKKESFLSLDFLTSYVGGVSGREVAVFTRQLATMISSGLPLARSLEVLVGQTENKKLREIIAGSLRGVQAGSSLSASLSKYPRTFSTVYINLIRAGEASGALDKILLRLAEAQEKQRTFINRTRGVLIYPAIVSVGMVIVFIIMILFVVPKLTVMYKDLGAELPLPTRMTIAFSDFLIGFWWVLLLAFLAVVAGFGRFKRTARGQKTIARIFLRLPIFGKINTQTQLATLSRTLALLIESGVPILEALEVSRGSVSNLLYSEALTEVNRAVEKGSSLSRALTKNKLFPSLLSQMVEVGEETGNLSEVLSRVGEFFESEIDQLVKNLSSALEPAIMVLLGVMIGFLILSVILPIYSLTSQL